MYWPEKQNHITEESFMKWFKDLGYDDEIQNILWADYHVYLKKYINKK